SVGIVGTVMQRTGRFLAAAETWSTRAERAMQLAGDPRLTGRPADLARLASEEAYARWEEEAHKQRAFNTKLARALNNSKRAGMLLHPDGAAERLGRVPGLGRVAPITRGIPVASWIVTGVAIGTDVAQGKDPAKATAAGVGGTIAGSAAGGAVAGTVGGGPIGTVAGLVVGTLVGAGVGYGIDRWGDDIINKVDDAVKDLSAPRPLK
ncbi:MAG: hypothetical protein ACRDOO_10760, partial [Actinomadura sp.]